MLNSITDKIIFLKPNDIIDLNKYKNQTKSIEIISRKAMEHWERLFTSQKQLITTNNVFEFKYFKNRI